MIFESFTSNTSCDVRSVGFLSDELFFNDDIIFNFKRFGVTRQIAIGYAKNLSVVKSADSFTIKTDIMPSRIR